MSQSEDMPPRILVSVLNWRAGDATLACLHSLSAWRGDRVRIVVVDNGSGDDSVARVRDRFPEIEVIDLAVNRGYALGHAVALKLALDWPADGILLLNNDVRVEAAALGELVRAWRATGEGVFGALPLSRDRSGAAWVNFPSKWLDPRWRPKPWGRDRHWRETDPILAASCVRVAAVVGCAWLIPMSVIVRHGWMDDAWFLYCEEVDYCLRLRAHGVQSFLVPAARIWHEGRGSEAEVPGVADCLAYYHTRNEILLARRYSGSLRAVLIGAKKLLRLILVGLRHPRRSGLMLCGWVDACFGKTGKTKAPERFVTGRGKPEQPPW